MIDKSSRSNHSFKISSIVPEIQDSILNKLFGSEYVNVRTLLQTTSQIVSNDLQSYEFELRFIDEDYHTSKQTWMNFTEQFNNDITLQNFTDDIIYNYETVIPLNNIHFRSYQKTGVYERKIMINNIVSRSECSNIIPLSIKLSKETSMSPATHLNKYINIQRRQRCSYTFNNPELSNWRIDKTMRFISTNINDKKMHMDIGIDNFQRLKFYDYLDIEFEYIGDFVDLYNSFFKLIETIYKPYEYFNMTYNIIKYVVNATIDINNNSLLSLIPTPTIMTNKVIHSLDINDYLFSYEITGEHVIVAIIGNILKNKITERDISIYTISESNMKHIYGTSNIHPSDKTANHNIINTIKSYTKNLHTNELPFITLFEAEYDGNKYVLLDTLMYCFDNVCNMNLSDRLKYITKFIDIDSGFINSMFKKITMLSNDIKSWSSLSKYTIDADNEHVNGIMCKSKNNSLFTSTIYKIKFGNTPSIDFKLCYISSRNEFYLYTIGYIDQIIKSKSLFNKYSIEHFGYSLLSNINTSKEVYILYVSPFMRNSFLFKPRSNQNVDTSKTNKIMTELYNNPIKYNNSIVKMIRIKDNWIPIDIINDEYARPTTYTEALRIGSIIYDNLNLDAGSNDCDVKLLNDTFVEKKHDKSHINTSNGNINKTTNNIIHTNNTIKKFIINIPNIISNLYNNVYYIINQYIIEKYFNKYKFESALDIFDDNNIYVNALYNIGLIKKLYAVNEKKYILDTYVEKSINKKFNEKIFIEGVKTRNNDINFDLSIIHSSPLKCDDVIDKLNKQYNYIPKSIDVVYYQTNLDNISSLIDIINIRLMCENILSPNGKIIFKLFDGDKILDFLENNYQVKFDVARNNKKRINKGLGIKYVDKLYININVTDDMYTVPNPESIKNINSNIANDKYQYENTTIDIIPQNVNKKLHISYINKFDKEYVKICYDNDEVIVNKPIQYDTIINDYNLGLICYYYYKFNRYDCNNEFKSNKLLSVIQTCNIRNILGINTELYSNVYDRVLDNWYSIYHNVDKLFGSKDYTQNALYDNDIKDGVLIEKYELDEHDISFIRNRVNSKYATAIATKTDLDIEGIFKLSLDMYNLYVIFPSFITNSDKSLLGSYLIRAFNTNSKDEIFKYYTCPDNITNGVYKPKVIFKKEFFSFIFESFKLYDICTPLTQVEIATYISSNREFSQFETVENFLNTLTVFCVERI